VKKLTFLILLAAPFFIQAQELDKSGYKFAEKVFNAFIDGDQKKLTDLYYPLDRHNELLSVQDITEIEQDVHDRKVVRMINRSLENRTAAGEFDFRMIELSSVDLEDSNDEEGLIYFNIKAAGTDGEKEYTVVIKQAIQFYNEKYYLTEDLNLIIK
jgi:hypothetical protein